MKEKLFKASLFIIFTTILYYFVIISFSSNNMFEMLTPATDMIAKNSSERTIIAIDEVENANFELISWLIASGLGMLTYAAKKGIDFGFTILEDMIKNKK
jgi:hypothetical protein